MLAYQPPVPRHRSLDLGRMSGIKPSDAPTPAKTGDGQPVGIATMLNGPSRGCIQIPKHLGIGNVGNDGGHQGGNIRNLGRIALTVIKLGGHRQIALLGKATADIADVFVDAENLLHHQHGGERPSMIGHGHIGRQFANHHRTG